MSERTPRLSELNGLDINPDSEAEKYPASGKPETGFAAARPRLERTTGIEPASSAWEAEVLPINYVRTVNIVPFISSLVNNFFRKYGK